MSRFFLWNNFPYNRVKNITAKLISKAMNKLQNHGVWEMPKAILPQKKLPVEHEQALKLLEGLAKIRLN